ncbi:sugar MFS transporter [Mucilaginibacter boryungensis]|uniref:Sugar MFS transporter n=1 Tax=Mucilaginibacter boryungensis TaxID=768480 RepID=A0ABR9XK70_9SPHI|nr:sugar MFS transporter [Mucilaginibacter boryungensis]MBE9667616.1 sugar MFS transporter [Mucilaginibacter boryungensis]
MTTAQQTGRPNAKGLSPIIIIGALFFVFGFVTWVNSVLIPYLKIACQLNNFESYLVAFSFYISYLVMAIPSARLLKLTGFKNGMACGLIVMAAGALIFIPAAFTRVYGLFLLGLFVQGTGLAVLQTASNPYITILGPAESAARRISIMGICNKVAGAIAPIILAAITLKNTDGLTQRIAQMNPVQKTAELNALSSRVIWPYVCIIVVLVILALMVYLSTLPEIDTDKEDSSGAIGRTAKTSILQFPHLLLGVATLFLYTGVEVLAGDTIISYGASQGIALSTAKFFTTCTLICMIIGYIIGIIGIPKYISQVKALQISAIIGVIFSIVAIFAHGYTSVMFIALLGLANSLMWPAIWPLAINGLGKFTKIGSSLLIMGIAGGAILPLLYGRLADVFNTQQAYWILVPSYIFILYFAVSGHKVGLTTQASKNAE